MFLILDESEEHPKMVLGGVLISEKKLSAFEGKFVDLRIKHKLFGEIKWNRIDQYYKRYCEFIDLFFDESGMTFHSICYRMKGANKYRAAYALIRTVTWKMQNAGINEPLYVLFDNDGNLGDTEARKIRRIAQNDTRFKQELVFCSQGTSQILGAMQVADLLTGAVCSVINGGVVSEERSYVKKHIKTKNNNIELNWSSLNLPRLNAHKIHFFDPDGPKKIT
jgi:hypothetical protein